MDRIAAVRPAGVEASPPAFPFTAAEFVAIQIGMLDPLPRPGGWTRFLRRAFGIRHVNALADPRLEVLRRASLALRASPALAADDLAAFIGAGFTVDQLDSLAMLARA